MSAAPVAVKGWPQWLANWIGGAENAGSPERRPVQLRGRINLSESDFVIGEARDALGTLIKLAPAFPPIVDGEEASKQKWRQLWAKAAVRAGYLHPGIDPEAYRVLCKLQERGRRVELIFDTSELTSGAGHWLVRFFGKHVDVVTTVISQREVHAWWDLWGGKKVENFATLERRSNYLAAARFIERLPHAHPIWRTLDVADEGALLMADGTRKGGKSPNADTLLFRAAKRYLLDQVPSLRRFFVTGDMGVARAAMHMLPAGSTITTWISALPARGAVVGPLHWWSSNGDYGAGVLSQLATFVVEALAICAEVVVEREDGAQLVARMFQPGANQSPSAWRAPVVWVAMHDSSEPEAAERRRSPEPAPAPAPTATRSEPAPDKPRWPLHFVPVRESRRRPSGARLPPRTVLDGVTSVMLVAQAGAELDMDALEGSVSQGRDLRRFLVDALQLVSPSGAPTEMGHRLPDIFARGDVDELASLMSVVDPFAQALGTAEKARTRRRSDEGPRDRKLDSFLALARALGLVVADENGALQFGGANPSRESLLKWLRRTLAELSSSDPLGEVPVLVVGQRALDELSLSPARFELALGVLLREEPRLVGKEGSSESKVLVETVARLSSAGVTWFEVSADGLCGQRALMWRNA